MKPNVFKFGEEVAGESFLGRRREIEIIAREMEPASGAKGVAIIGMNRIGKTSLINRILETRFRGRSDVIVVSVSLKSYTHPIAFWYSLVTVMQDCVHESGISDSVLEERFSRILDSDATHAMWFSAVFTVAFYRILERIQELNRRLILVLDEFDNAIELFSTELGSFGIIRDCAYLAKYNSTVVVLSRRSLGTIEKGSLKGSGSTLEEVFFKYNLGGFSEDDMFDYWSALTDYDVFCNDKMTALLQHYAGTNPYILSFYAKFMVEASIAGELVTEETLKRIYGQERVTHLFTYYEKLVERMKLDGFAELLRGILCGPIVGITQNDVSVLIARGYLHMEGERFVLVSEDFTSFFVEQTADVISELWTSIMSVEGRFRKQMKLVFPRLEDFRYRDIAQCADWAEQVSSIYPTLRVKVDTARTFMLEASNYGKDASLIDVFTLTFVIDTMKHNWNRFKGFFNGEEYSAWEPKLDLIKRVRNPFAHSHPEYLTPFETNLVQIYCAEILALERS